MLARVLIGACLACFISNQAIAQSEISVPSDTKFVVKLDLAAFGETEIGGKIVQVTKEMAQAELGEDEDAMMEKIIETVGFDPLEEVKSMTIMGLDYERPEKGMRMMLQLGNTAGNLEGLALTLPNYEAEEVGGYTIHSAHEDKMKAFATIHTGSTGAKTVVVATSKEDLMGMLDSLKSSAPSSLQEAKAAKGPRQISWTVPTGTFAQVHVLEMPGEMMKGGPQANIAKLVSDLSLTVGESEDQIEVSVALTAANEKKAEQLRQLAQGAKAMISLFQDEVKGDEEAEMAMEILKKVTIEQDGSTLMLHVEIPQELIMVQISDNGGLSIEADL